MVFVFLGVVAFIPLVLSDFLALKQRKGGCWLFAAGSLVLVTSALLLLADGDVVSLFVRHPLHSALWGTGVVLFFALLMSALFLALPKSAYGAGPKELVCSGWYAACRHPGALLMGGLLLCQWALLATTAAFWALLLWEGAELVYVTWQDRVVFPKVIPGYDHYRTITPFLVPTSASLRAALDR